eukprot:549383-Pyramimonas_sp.AAC.1
MVACIDGVRRVELLQEVGQHANSVSEEEWRSKWGQGDVQGCWDRLSSCIRQAMAERPPKVAYDKAECEQIRQERIVLLNERSERALTRSSAPDGLQSVRRRRIYRVRPDEARLVPVVEAASTRQEKAKVEESDGH